MDIIAIFVADGNKIKINLFLKTFPHFLCSKNCLRYDIINQNTNCQLGYFSNCKKN